MTSYGVRIAGVGHYVPERVLSNNDLEKILDTSDEWITTRTGMKERRIASPGELTSDMALAASRMALESANLAPSDIDCVIVGTVSGDYPFPATACILGSKLGIAGKPAFDIEVACSGFIYGFVNGTALIRAGLYRRVLVVGAEKLSAITNYRDRGTGILFGDGAGAAVFERSDEDCYLGSELGADGTTPEQLYIPAGGVLRPLDAEGIANNDTKIAMRGREVFKIAVTKMAESAEIVLARAGLSAADVTLLIPHQANRRIIDAMAKVVGLPHERVYVNIERYGNTSAASVPIALSEAYHGGRISPGDLVLFCGFGGGLSWGSIAWRWA